MSAAVELFREWIAASAHPDTDAVLRRHGVTDPEIRSVCALARIEHDSDGFFQPHLEGSFAIIVPLVDSTDILDLVAFDPREPYRCWCRLGGEPVLGVGALANQWVGQPLHLYRTPLSWLQYGCDGVVVLDFNRAAIDLITAQNGIIAEDQAHVSELHRELSKAAQWRLPGIYPPQKCEAA